MTNYTLRPAQQSESGIIRDLIHLTGINPMGLDWKRFIVAVNDSERVIGVGQVKPHGTEIQELASIAVFPEYRGQGVARAIIEHLLKDSPRPLRGLVYPSPAPGGRHRASRIMPSSLERGLSGICIASAKVEVRGGRVVQVNLIDLLGTGMVSNDSLPPSKWANPYYPDQFFCDYANFTMPQLFDMVKRSSWSVSDITFDPNYGFISGVRFGQPDGRGVLNARISDCCSGFGIRNFQVLEE